MQPPLGGAATAWAAAALSARACRLPSLCAARERSGAQGSVAARGNAAVVAAAAAAAARAGGLIRTGRSDRLGGRRRSRRKLSIYVQKPLGRVCCAVCSRKTNGCLCTSSRLARRTSRSSCTVLGFCYLLVWGCIADLSMVPRLRRGRLAGRALSHPLCLARSKKYLPGEIVK